MSGTNPSEEQVQADIAATSSSKLFEQLSSSEKGLGSEEAKARQQKYGMNDISEKKVNPLIKFLWYFYGPIPFMIEFAVVLSAIIGHWDDFFIILALLFTNAIVGFYQEYKAGNAIEELKQKLAPNAKVLRDGKWEVVPARELVPGDVVRVRLGDIVPADIKLIEGQFLEVDQSALTGESLPVEKALDDAAYSSSIVRKGEMNGLGGKHRNAHLFRQDDQTGGGGHQRKSLPEEHNENWQLSDRHRRGPGDGGVRRCHHP